jgi:hypothetical protein
MLRLVDGTLRTLDAGEAARYFDGGAAGGAGLR